MKTVACGLALVAKRMKTELTVKGLGCLKTCCIAARSASRTLLATSLAAVAAAYGSWFTTVLSKLDAAFVLTVTLTALTRSTDGLHRST
jgi:hypothetical protein